MTSYSVSELSQCTSSFTPIFIHVYYKKYCFRIKKCNRHFSPFCEFFFTRRYRAQVVAGVSPLWQQLSACIDVVETSLPKSDASPSAGLVQPKPILPNEAWQLKPLIEGYLLLCSACGVVPSRFDGDMLAAPINKLSLSSSGGSMTVPRSNSMDLSVDSHRLEDPFALCATSHPPAYLSHYTAGLRINRTPCLNFYISH